MAQPAVTVRIATVQEEDWLREADQGPAENLRDRLKAQTIVELHGAAFQDRRLVLRTGREEKIVTNWTYTDNNNNVVARKTEQEWIGTQVVVQQGLAPSDGKQGTVNIDVTHDISAPTTELYEYATAAQGAERARHTVPMPRFHRMHWTGEIVPDSGERLLTSFQTTDDPATRIVVFFQSEGTQGETTSLNEVRQTIYRVPEMEMVELLLSKPAGDADIILHLEKARTAGRASIVSEATITAGDQLPGKAQAGIEYWLPTEMNPDYNRLLQLPAAFESVLAGTRLEFQQLQAPIPPRENQDINNPFHARPSPNPPNIHWQSWVGSPAPQAVVWPTSWLHVYDDVKQQPTGKAITGFMNWYDRFAQEITTDLHLPDNSPHIIAMLPPADQVWCTTRKGRWLDVTVARHQNHTATAPIKPATEAAASPCLLIGISLDSRRALALLQKRSGQDDRELLDQLMQQVRQNTAHIRLCSAVTSSSHAQALRSGRHHAYPTEMPSIPSAWDTMLIGTDLQCEDQQISLEQDLAGPSRQEWKLALDVPEAVMWEPGRRRFRTQHTRPAKSGTYLCSAAAIPAILAGPDMPAGETLLVFTHQDRLATPAPLEPQPPHVEIEALLFEVPSDEATTWETVRSTDFTAFTEKQLDTGAAKLIGHVMQRQRQASEGRIELVEDQMSAVEFDPPEKEAPGRMRPTALETLPVGTFMSLDCSAEIFAEGGHLKLELQQSIAKPVEPGLAELLKITKNGEEPHHDTPHLASQWKTELQKVKPNEMRCLGVQRLPGNDKSVHIAYVRVREAK